MHSSLETYDKVPAFLYKLWKLVEDRSTNDLIHWQKDGKSFMLYKVEQFSRELLPRYYKHANMASFVRQLNMYGFRKVPSMEGGGLRLDRDEMEFAHPHFVRGHEEQLEFIKRKATNSREPGVGGTVDDSRITELMTEMSALHRKQETLITQMNGLRRENAEVWGRYCDIDQKLQMQNNIIEKLTRFVVSVLKPKGLNMANVRRLPQLQALIASHSIVPALTQGRSPLSDGPVIHEVVDDVLSAADVAAAVSTQPLLATSLQQPHLQPPTSSAVQPGLSGATTTMTDPASAAANRRVMSLGGGAASDMYTVVGGSGNIVPSVSLDQQQHQQQQQYIVDSDGIEGVYITSSDMSHLPPAPSMQTIYNTSNITTAGNFGDEFAQSAPGQISSISGLPVNSNPIVESPKGSLLSGSMVGTSVNTGLQEGGSSTINTPMMVTIAGTSSNNSTVSSNATLFHGDNAHLTPSTLAQTVRDNFLTNDSKLSRNVSQIKTNANTASVGHGVSSNFNNSRGPPTLTFTVGPNNTLIPTKNTQVVLSSSSDASSFTGVPIKQEIVLGAPLISPAPSSTTTTTAPFLTRTGKQQHIVTNVSVIPNSNRVSISNISNNGNKIVGGSSGGKHQAVITNLDDTTLQNNNVTHSKRGIQNYRISSGGKKQILLKNNNNANNSSTGNNFNNTISTMGNIVPSYSGMPGASNTTHGQGVTTGLKRQRETTSAAPSVDRSVTGTTSSTSSMPVFKVVRKTALPVPQQQSSQQETEAAASELVAAAADLLLPTPTTTDVVPLSNKSRDDMNKQMEDVQTMLDSLQDLFHSGQLERDSSGIYSHIFNPDFPLPDFEAMTGLDAAPTDQTGGGSVDTGLQQQQQHQQQHQQQQQLALYNPPGAQDLTALLDSPSRHYLAPEDEQPFAMASLDPDLINTPNVLSRTPVRKKVRMTAPIKKEADMEDDDDLDPFLSSLYAQGH